MKTIETQRLLLRPWSMDDAEQLFALAQDPDVGPRAGWPPHQSVDESREVIRTVFANDHTWAIVMKETEELIGCMGYYTHEESNIGIVSVSAEDNRTDSAYSEDIFYQKEAGTELVWLSDDGALQKGTFTSRNAEVSGYDKAVLTAEGSMEGTSEGAGLYDTTGNYIGTLITEKNGTLIAVPADQVYSYFKVNH